MIEFGAAGSKSLEPITRARDEGPSSTTAAALEVLMAKDGLQPLMIRAIAAAVAAHPPRRPAERILADAAKNGYLVAGAHISFPGIGHIAADGKGYRWLPVSYTEIH